MTKTYILPAKWAPYLLKGDESGLSLRELNDADRFTLELPVGDFTDASEPYARDLNDADTGPGEVCDFTFTLR